MSKEVRRTPRKKAPDIDEYTPDPSRTCEYYLNSGKFFCDTLADYRVKLASGHQLYLCEKHFKIKYNYSPQSTPKMTYLKIIR